MKNLLLASTFETFGDKIDQLTDIVLSSKKVVCVPTAAYGQDNHDWLEPEMEQIRKRTAHFSLFDIAGKSQDETRTAMQDADIVYVTGGNTYYLLEHIQKSGFAAVLKEKLDQGAYYFGSSAGAIVMCPYMDFIEDMDDASRGSPDGYEAMAFVDFLIMPHTDSEHYGEKAMHLISKKKSGQEKIIGLRDDQALHIQDNYIEIY